MKSPHRSVLVSLMKETSKRQRIEGIFSLDFWNTRWLCLKTLAEMVHSELRKYWVLEWPVIRMVNE